MGKLKERVWHPMHLPEFRAEYDERLERALMRAFPSAPITARHQITYEGGEVGVIIPPGLSKESRRRYIAIVEETYHEVMEEFDRSSYLISHEQKNEPVTGIALNSSSPTPAPQFGERLLLLLLRTKEERANIPGDLEEEFKQIAARYGARYAKLWYYKQVAASVWPLMRKAVGWGLLASVAEWVRGRI